MFTGEVLQGCATGSGGGQVLFPVAAQTLRMVVEETGGFQNFVSREVRLLEQAMAGAPAEDASPEFYGRVKELQSQFRQGKKPPRR